MRSSWQLSMALALTALSSAAAQTPTKAPVDFSGVWVLDTLQSSASVLRPKAATYTIKQSATTMTMLRDITNNAPTAQPLVTTVIYTLNGKPSKNVAGTGAMALPAYSTLTWDGPVLTIRTTASVGRGAVAPTEVVQTDVMKLLGGGTKLEIDRSIEQTGHIAGPAKLILLKKS